MVKPPEPGGPRVPLDEKVGLPKRQKGGEGGTPNEFEDTIQKIERHDRKR